MNDRRLRAFVDDLELTAALLAYVNTVDVDVDVPIEDDDAPLGSPPFVLALPAKVIPLRRASRRKPPAK